MTAFETSTRVHKSDVAMGFMSSWTGLCDPSCLEILQFNALEFADKAVQIIVGALLASPITTDLDAPRIASDDPDVLLRLRLL